MTKKNFMFLVLAVVGGLLFALGMCMCLLPEWNAFTPGVVVTALGALVLLAIALVRWIMAGKPIAKVNWNKVGKIAYCVVAALVLGAGMVTALELLAGLLVNREFAVWDYRNLPYNFHGQICLNYSLLWMPLTLFGMWLNDAASRRLQKTSL